jgi:hypothetical protein
MADVNPGELSWHLAGAAPTLQTRICANPIEPEPAFTVVDTGTGG